MTPVNMRNDFAQAGVRKIVLAEHQPEYDPLPCLVFPREGYVLSEWTPTPQELEALVAGGRVRLFTYTYGEPFQPVQMVAVGPEEMLALETVS